MLFSMRLELLGSTLLTFTRTVQQHQSQLLRSKTFSFIRICRNTFPWCLQKTALLSHRVISEVRVRWRNVCVYVCVFVDVCVCVCECVCLWVIMCMWVCLSVRVFLCMIICVCLSVYVWLCASECVWVCENVCVSVFVSLCVFLVDSELFTFKQFITTIYRTFLS